MALEVELDKKKLEYTNEDGQKVRVDVDQDLTEKEEEAFESNHYANLAEELENQEVLNTLNKKLLETCIEKGTHKYVREYECLSYGDTEYRCKTCGLYK